MGERYRVEGDDREHVEGLFLCGRMEQVLDGLFGQLRCERLVLRSDMLRVERPLEPEERLDDVAEVFRCLREVAWLCEGKEVRVAALDAPGLAWTAGTAGVLCPYCRDGLDLAAPDLTACPSCRTVHHAACFAEAGGCTVFGCRSVGSAPVSA